jgi:parallel beta-helix repeat protein
MQDMKRKAVPGIMLMLLATSMTILTFNVRIAVAQETIYIRSDGSVDPPTAPITRAGNIYTFTANISKPMVIQKDNIVMDGNGYTLLGSEESYGFSLDNRSNVTIRKTRVTGYNYGVHMNVSRSNTVTESLLENNVLSGVWLESSTKTNITNNDMANNYCGILLTWSDNNNITSNAVKNNPFGIWILGSSGNTVKNNTIADNDVCGIWLDQSSTAVYHNDFINNTAQAETSDSTNTWDDGYPIGGNYWRGYAGVDLKRGPNQDQPGSDGIGDTPYVVDVNNTDRYPLMSPLFTTMPGDLNGDSKVSLADLVILAQAYGSKPGDPKWNPIADIDGNGVVGLTDLVILAKNYGKTAP